MAESPSAFSTGHLMSASSSWTGGFLPSDVLTFGFAATQLHINNSCGDRIFFDVQGAASTNSDFVKGTGELLFGPITPFGGISLLTTSSSSSSRPLVGISAWGSA